MPDIYVGQADISLKESGDFIKERDLSGHLENGENNGAKQADTKASLAETDFQLYEALNLLKALAIVKPNKVAEAEVKTEVEAQPVTAE